MDPIRTRRGKAFVSAALVLFVVLNFITLVQAYPETRVTDPGCCGTVPLAKDFSAFYTGAWRLIHDTSQVYTPGYLNDGEYQILPHPETYKYLPSFLFIVAPFLALGYQQALTAFDAFQFVLLVLMAPLIYALVRQRGLAATVIIAGVVLVLPFPLPHWGLSAPYYWQWAEGQSKVLETFLLLLSFYLGMKRMPKLSGIVFALSAFDPRYTLIAIPLFVMYNRSKLRQAFAMTLGGIAVTNAVLLYPGLGSGFLTMLFSTGLSTPPYYYTFIPVAAVVALSVLNVDDIVESFKSLPKP